jgi:hypothetical protein
MSPSTVSACDRIEMLQEIKSWGVKPEWVSGDSWYSSLANLKFLRNEAVGFLFGVADHRKESLERGQEIQVQRWVIPASGLGVYLKEFGWVKVCSGLQKRSPILHPVPARIKEFEAAES